MPAWITITAAHLEDARVAELVAALREEALGDTQTDPLPRFIQTVVDEIRSCIGYCVSTPLDVDPAKIPANLKDLAVQKIVRAMKGRLLQPLSDDEKADEKTYQQRLLLLTECAWPVDKTDTPIAAPSVNQVASTPRITERERGFTRQHQDGI